MNERIQALRQVKLFKSLNRSEIENAAEALEVVEFEEGEYVLRQHEQGSEFFMVDSGECVVEVHGGVVHRYVDGALLNDEPRTASIRVTSKALVCFRMKQEVFKKIMTEQINLLQQMKLLQSFSC